MDRISALRNVEDAIRAFEDGEADLAETERRVGTVLRTYATEFEREDRRAYRVTEGPGEGRVVVAGSPADARQRAVDLAAGAQTTGTAEDTDDVGDIDESDVSVEPL